MRASSRLEEASARRRPRRRTSEGRVRSVRGSRSVIERVAALRARRGHEGRGLAGGIEVVLVGADLRIHPKLHERRRLPDHLLHLPEDEPASAPTPVRMPGTECRGAGTVTVPSAQSLASSSQGLTTPALKPRPSARGSAEECFDDGTTSSSCHSLRWAGARAPSPFFVWAARPERLP
jgi:hypothetical protein